MANYNLMVNSQFQPLTYQEIAEPLLRQTKVHEGYEAQMGELSAKANLWKNLADKENDPKAYSMYEGYMKQLQDNINNLNSEGLAPETSQSLMELKKNYSSQITPIEQAYGIRAKQAEQLNTAKLQDGTLISERDPSHTSLDRYIDNPNLGNRFISGAKVHAMTAKLLSQYTRVLRERVEREDINGMHPKLVSMIRKGASEEEVINMLKGDRELYQEFMYEAMNRVKEATGINDWDKTDGHYYLQNLKTVEDYIHSAAPFALGEQNFHSSFIPTGRGSGRKKEEETNNVKVKIRPIEISQLTSADFQNEDLLVKTLNSNLGGNVTSETVDEIIDNNVERNKLKLSEDLQDAYDSKDNDKIYAAISKNKQEFDALVNVVSALDKDFDDTQITLSSVYNSLQKINNQFTAHEHTILNLPFEARGYLDMNRATAQFLSKQVIANKHEAVKALTRTAVLPDGKDDNKFPDIYLSGKEISSYEHQMYFKDKSIVNNIGIAYIKDAESDNLKAEVVVQMRTLQGDEKLNLTEGNTKWFILPPQKGKRINKILSKMDEIYQTKIEIHKSLDKIKELSHKGKAMPLNKDNIPTPSKEFLAELKKLETYRNTVMLGHTANMDMIKGVLTTFKNSYEGSPEIKKTEMPIG